MSSHRREFRSPLVLMRSVALVLALWLLPDAAAAQNQPPVADAGPDIMVAVGFPAQLQGMATDPDDDPIATWTWTLDSAPMGSAAALQNPFSPTPTLVPDLPGSFVVSLVVSDGMAPSLPDSVTITAEINLSPTANAGPDATVKLGAAAALQGSATDPEDDPIVLWTWTIESAPAGSTAMLNGPFSPTPSLRPDVAGDYVISLVVSDGLSSSAPDTVTITVEPNEAPIADAGPDQTVAVGQTVALAGSATDPDDDPILIWTWTIDSAPAGSTAMLDEPLSPSPSLVPDVAGDYVISLVASDGLLDSAPDTVTVTAFDNAPPVADAGADRTIALGTSVLLLGMASDPDDDPITLWSWAIDSAPAGSVATLDNPFSPTPRLTPDLEGDYVISLVVSDGIVPSAPDTVTITAIPNQAPIANAGPDQAIELGATAALQGMASDPDDDPIVLWSWAIDSAPAASVATLNNPFSQSPTIIPDVEGSYVISLVVSDGVSPSAPDTLTIVVTGDPPAVPLLDGLASYGVLAIGLLCVGLSGVLRRDAARVHVSR